MSYLSHFLTVLLCSTCLAIVIPRHDETGNELSGSTVNSTQVVPDKIDFDQQIKPIFSDRCFACHGPDSAQRKADLRLDLEESAREVITPGDADDSELYLRITSDDESEKMPPVHSKLSVSSAEAILIRDWINQGATWKKHWSFVPTATPEVPVVNDAWIQNEIDAFVLHELNAIGLQPNAMASKERLIRRVTFDLIGLPPTLAEIDAFVADRSEDAYEKLVDRLLASEAFGERMATDWLDAARYSDTYGYQVDRDRFVWPWRDWVVRAFNSNLSYRQFIIEQLAGDLLPEPTDDQILATAFNRLHPQKVEGGSVPEEFRVEYVADRTQTFATAFLGLTLECARCHDHKFDPISQQEYYQLYSFFNNIDEAGLYSYFTQSIPTPTLSLTDEAKKKELAELKSLAAEELARLRTLKETLEPDFKAWLQNGNPSSVPQTAVQPTLSDFEKLNLAGNEKITDDQGRPGVKLNGDDEVGVGTGNFPRQQPFTVSLRLNTPDVKSRAVVFHRSRAWTDAASRGYQLLIEDGRLSASLIHFWPGNAIRVVARNQLEIKRWVHVAIVYDGSSTADGLQIFVDGEKQDVEIVRDNLYRNITGGGGDNITIGARFRDRGFTGGQVSDFRVDSRQLSAWEISCIANSRDALKLADEKRAEAAGQEQSQLFDYYLLNRSEAYAKQLATLQAARQKFNSVQDKLSEIMVMREMAKPRQAHVLTRGQYDQPNQVVVADTPKIFGNMPEGLQKNRLGLAQWLTDPQHPLTSRVAVNRFWQIIFGQGLVRTPEDFGRQGSSPTHPQLLDWLARDFVEHDWDVKRLLKQIVMSATYRQSSEVSKEKLSTDPDNRWLARAPSYRLPAEMLRDNVLAASGLLVNKIGGPPAKPYEVAVSFKPVAHDKNENLYRRSVYTYWKRTGPAPVMMTLDAAKRDVCRVKREKTSTPLQSLVMMNGPQFVEAARKIAEKLLNQHPSAVENRDSKIADDMFRLLTSRHPDENEIQIVLELFNAQLVIFSNDAAATQQYLSIGESKPDEKHPASELAAWTSVANTLMNLDECVTKR